MTLSNKQKQYLKGLAHPLKPVVLLGANGLTEGVMLEIDHSLDIHELIKVKVPTNDRETKAHKVQVIGHVIVLYRQSEDKKIQLPR